jgi:hypothetical protein
MLVVETGTAPTNPTMPCPIDIGYHRSIFLIMVIMMLHDYAAGLNILISYLEIESRKPLRDWHLLPYSHASPAIPLLLLDCHSKLSNV